MRLGEDQRGAGGAALRKLRARGSQEGVWRPVQARPVHQGDVPVPPLSPMGPELGGPEQQRPAFSR